MTRHQLTRLRKSIGFTKAEFSRLVGVHPATVTRWEAGTLEIPRIAEIAILAQVKNVKMELAA